MANKEDEDQVKSIIGDLFDAKGGNYHLLGVLSDDGKLMDIYFNYYRDLLMVTIKKYYNRPVVTVYFYSPLGSSPEGFEGINLENSQDALIDKIVAKFRD